MLYIASPYSDPSASVREERYREARRIVAELIKEGFYAYSPIVHFHHMAVHHGLPTAADFWQYLNNNFIYNSEQLWIAAMPGWDLSTGIREERLFAQSCGKQIFLLSPDNLAIEPLPEL